MISLLVRRKVHPVFCPTNDRVNLGHGAMEQCLTIGGHYLLIAVTAPIRGTCLADEICELYVRGMKLEFQKRVPSEE